MTIVIILNNTNFIKSSKIEESSTHVKKLTLGNFKIENSEDFTMIEIKFKIIGKTINQDKNFTTVFRKIITLIINKRLNFTLKEKHLTKIKKSKAISIKFKLQKKIPDKN
jgi:hypothetical protein